MSLGRSGKDTSEIGEGSNTVNGQVFDVMQILSSFSGTCLNIQPRFETGPPFINLYIKPTIVEAVEAIDQMNRIVVYLTSNNSWQGISSGDWPQYTPTKIELDCKEKGYAYMNTIKVSEQLFVEGVDDSNQCWAEEIKSGSCPVKCMFVNFAGNASKLPICQTIEEVTCMIDEATRQKSFTKCNQKKRILTFNGDLMRLKKYQYI